MRRFRIRSLMGLVVVVAVGFCALRFANDLWAGCLMMATPLLLGVVLIGGVCGDRTRRPARLGFAILGGAYFATTLFGLNEGNLARLPTSALLMKVHLEVAGAPSSVIAGTGNLRFVQGINQNVTVVDRSRWLAIMPGAASFDSFQDVGHCLFALMAGGIGAIVACQFARDPDHDDSR